MELVEKEAARVTDKPAGGAVKLAQESDCKQQWKKKHFLSACKYFPPNDLYFKEESCYKTS